jgi:hypothetical protein
MKLNPIFLLLTAGVFLMLNSYGFSENIQYEKYTSPDHRINLSLDYVLGWGHAEQRGALESFWQIVFFPPRGKNSLPQPAITLTVEKNSESNLLDLNSFAQNLLNKRMKFKNMQVLTNSKINLGGLEAKDITVSYDRLKEIYSIKAQFITIEERLVIFQRDSRFYTLRYENEKSNFNNFAESFSYILGTLNFNSTK